MWKAGIKTLVERMQSRQTLPGALSEIPLQTEAVNRCHGRMADKDVQEMTEKAKKRYNQSLHLIAVLPRSTAAGELGVIKT